MTLMDRMFGTDEEVRLEIAEDREKSDGSSIEQAQWVRMPYMEVFLGELEVLLDQNEAQPGPHEEMLYRAGTRNGLLIVKRFIRDIEQRAEGDVK